LFHWLEVRQKGVKLLTLGSGLRSIGSGSAPA
jgi:hypothetical protein